MIATCFTELSTASSTPVAAKTDRNIEVFSSSQENRMVVDYYYQELGTLKQVIERLTRLPVPSWESKHVVVVMVVD